jgi:hypothetical protein
VNARSKAASILRGLRFDFNAFTIDRFVGHIEGIRQRRIHRIPLKMPAAMFGAWISDGDDPEEWIFYRDDVPPIHQIHIQLHELAHLLLGHPTLTLTKEEMIAMVRGDQGPAFSELVSLRSNATSSVEVEAETLASMIQEQVILHAHIDQLVGGISSDERIAGYLKDLRMT